MFNFLKRKQRPIDSLNSQTAQLVAQWNKKMHLVDNLWAIYANPELGTNMDQLYAEENGLVPGMRYKVFDIEVGLYSSSVKLGDRWFNPASFRFVNKRKEVVDVYRMPEFNASKAQSLL